MFTQVPHRSGRARQMHRIGMVQHADPGSDSGILHSLPGRSAAEVSQGSSFLDLGAGLAASPGTNGLGLWTQAAAVAPSPLSVNQIARPTAWVAGSSRTIVGYEIVSGSPGTPSGIVKSNEPLRHSTQQRTGLPVVADSVVDELAAELIQHREMNLASPARSQPYH